MAKVIVTVSTQKAEGTGWRSNVMIGREFLSTSWHATKSAAVARSRSHAKLWGSTLPKDETNVFIQANATMNVIPAENKGWRAEIRVGDKTPKTVWVITKQGAIKWANNIARRVGIPKQDIKITTIGRGTSHLGSTGLRQRDFDRA